ncbi:Pol-like polyprotein/retrotransposon [Trema orientale]|uniref:Pol-like polyprotein/retrotransposon n=1 Tax=Trema orientale TaxID=63057 RepID=A0A2P5D0W5_TREOI|nr:Pol-like polyprotein/retrotransposon [Trema orientale]
MSRIKFSTPVRADVEKFDGNINFGLWQIQVKDLLIQSGLHKALKGREALKGRDSEKSSMSDEDWEDLDERAASAIRICLAKNVLANVLRITTAKDLWGKLGELYQANGVSNAYERRYENF